MVTAQASVVIFGSAWTHKQECCALTRMFGADFLIAHMQHLAGEAQWQKLVQGWVVTHWGMSFSLNTHTHIHTYKHIHSHTDTLTHTHANTHTHTHKRTQTQTLTHSGTQAAQLDSCPHAHKHRKLWRCHCTRDLPESRWPSLWPSEAFSPDNPPYPSGQYTLQRQGRVPPSRWCCGPAERICPLLSESCSQHHIEWATSGDRYCDWQLQDGEHVDLWKDERNEHFRKWATECKRSDWDQRPVFKN